MLITPEDHVAISNLIARYCLTLDCNDIEGWVSLFQTDASYQVYGRSYEGHPGLQEMMTAAPTGLHLGGPPVIQMIDGDHAQTRRNLLFIDGTSGISRSAVYTDDLVRTSEGWKIAHCRCQFITKDGLSDRPER